MKVSVFPAKIKLCLGVPRSVIVFVFSFMLMVMACSVPGANAATITVSNLNDSGTGSLRQAVTDAMASGSADDINFSVSGTIALSSALPDITAGGGTLTIDGTGQTVTISGNDSVRVTAVDVNASLSLINLTISGGNSGDGGGIYNSGTLTVSNCTFSNNTAEGIGGAIVNNVGGGSGSGIGALTIANSTFDNNTANDDGGAIYNNNGDVTITNSTFTGNSAAGSGGSITNFATMTVINSTFSGNSAAGSGGGIYNGSGTVTLLNTIVANSTSGGNCSGLITNGGHNIDSGTTCGWASENGSMSNTDPLLGPLADNGGLTQTMALSQGSPAIDAATPNNSPSTDQRGIARPQGAGPDVGAYEYGSAVQTLPMSLTLNRSSYTVGDPMNVDLTIANPGSQVTADVYFAILLPASSGPSFGCPQGDALVFFSKGMTGASVVCASDPIQSFPRTFKGVTIPAGLPSTSAKNFLSVIWLQGAPAGQYQIIMVLTRANALLDGTVDPGDVIGVATATMSFGP